MFYVRLLVMYSGYVLVIVEPYKLLLQRVLNIYLLHTQPYKRKYNLLTFRPYQTREK